ncbi:HU family DNA-binding protein [Nocardioides pakistanensis]
MNKSQLIDTLATRFEGNRKQAAHALESVLDTITREVAKGEKVAITGFGSFEKRVRDARWVRNPRTGERIKAKKTAVPKFNPGADLKAVVSGAKKLPKLTISAATGTARAAAGSAKKAAPAKKTATKAAPAKKTATKTAAATKSTAAKKTTTKAAPAKKTATKSTAAKKTATKSTAKKAPAAKAPAKKTTTAKKAPAKKTATKSTAKKAPAKKA